MNIQFTPVRQSDAPTLARLDQNAFGADQAWPVDQFEAALRDPASEGELAMGDQKAVGYSLWRYGRATVNLDSLAVSSEARGQKIGERLLLRGLERAVEKGCQVATLQVEKGNTPAEKLYEKYGFVPTKILTGYYYGNDGVEMQLKDLQGAGKELLEERKALLGSFPGQTFITK